MILLFQKRRFFGVFCELHYFFSNTALKWWFFSFLWQTGKTFIFETKKGTFFDTFFRQKVPFYNFFVKNLDFKDLFSIHKLCCIWFIKYRPEILVLLSISLKNWPFYLKTIVFSKIIFRKMSGHLMRLVRLFFVKLSHFINLEALCSSQKTLKNRRFWKKGTIFNKSKFSLSEKGTSWTTKSRTKVLTRLIHKYMYIWV